MNNNNNNNVLQVTRLVAGGPEAASPQAPAVPQVEVGGLAPLVAQKPNLSHHALPQSLPPVLGKLDHASHDLAPALHDTSRVNTNFYFH